MMKTPVQILLPLVVCCAAWGARAVEPAGTGSEPHGIEPVSVEQAIRSDEEWTRAVEGWKTSGEWPVGDLVKLLKSERLGIRCMAIDILEELAEDDFGYDPWTMPERIPAQVYEDWETWAGIGKVAVYRQGALSAEERGALIEKQVGLILTGSDHVRERANRVLQDFPDETMTFITRYIKAHPGLAPRSLDELKTTRNRVLFAKHAVDNAPRLASMIAKGTRNDIIDGLEEIRVTKQPGLLPAVESYLQSKDAMIRETAVDVYLSLGGKQALQYIMPLLNREKDPNVLQIAFRRAIDHATPDMVALYKRYAMQENEDLALAALESLAEVGDDVIAPLSSGARGSRSLIGRIFGSSEEKESDKDNKYLPTETDLLALLGSGNWRIRQAALGYVNTHHRSFNKNLEAKIIECLSDDDASVRDAALQVCFSTRLKPAMPAIRQLGLQDSDKFPVIIYAIAAFDDTLNDSLTIALKRASAEQVATLIQYDSSFTSVLNVYGRSGVAKEIFDLLKENVNGDVKNMIAGIALNNILNNPGDWEFVMARLEDSGVSIDAKREIVSNFSFSQYNDNDRQFIFRSMPESELTLSDYSKARRGQYKPTSQELRDCKPYEEAFIRFLRRCATRLDDPEQKSLALTCARHLVEMGDPVTMSYLADRFDGFDAETSSSIAYATSSYHFGKSYLRLLVKLLENGKSDVSSLEYSLRNIFTMLDDPAISAETREDILGVFRQVVSNPETCIQSLELIFKTDPRTWSLLRDELKKVFHNAEYIPELRLAAAMGFWHAINRVDEADIAAVKEIDHPRKDFVLHLFRKPDYGTPEYANWLRVLAESDRADERFSAVCFAVNILHPPLVAELGDRGKFVLPPNDGMMMFSSSPQPAKQKMDPQLNGIVAKLMRDRDRYVNSMALAVSLYMGNVDGVRKKLGDLAALFSEGYRTESEIDVIKFAIVNFYSESSKTYSDEELELARAIDQREGMWMVSIPYYVLERIGNTSRRPAGAAVLSFSKFKADEGFSADLMATSPPRRANAGASVQELRQMPLTVVFFEKAGCRECEETRRWLGALNRQYPNMQVKTWQISTREGIEYNTALCGQFELSHRDRHVTPAVFMRAGALMRNNLNEAALSNLAGQSADLMAKEGEGGDLWYERADMAKAASSLKDSLQHISIGIVLGGGLLDGINPCAFATLIFFLSYLQIARRQPREMLLTGVAFISAVYLTYFAIGLLFHRLIGSIQALSGVRPYVDGLFVTLALLAAALSFRDAWKAKQGDLSGMSLVLPGFLKERIRRVTRAQARSSRFVMAAFIAGVVISFLELACTGQVYAPIIYQIQEGWYSAVGMLALYNLAFIAPLVLIFVLTYRGLKTQALIDFQKKHTFLVKTGMGVLFLILAAVILAYSFL